MHLNGISEKGLSARLALGAKRPSAGASDHKKRVRPTRAPFHAPTPSVASIEARQCCAVVAAPSLPGPSCSAQTAQLTTTWLIIGMSMSGSLSLVRIPVCMRDHLIACQRGPLVHRRRPATVVSSVFFLYMVATMPRRSGRCRLHHLFLYWDVFGLLPSEENISHHVAIECRLVMPRGMIQYRKVNMAVHLRRSRLWHW